MRHGSFSNKLGTDTCALPDRVFVHALNTVKRIPRTGTARPPAAERLALYGLYKQSMGEWQRCDREYN
jgi:hypothetical protein